MEMLQKLIICAFIYIAALRVLVHSQSQSAGFISIDCGIPENSDYTDKATGLNYTSDATFIETGVGNNISSEYNSTTLEQQFLNVRSFPEGKKNCYTLKRARSHTKFLIRARFMYGNYDGQGKVPSFNLLLEADLWDSVELTNASTIVTKEIIHIPQKNYIYVCLENTGFGTPFISALELRRLKNSTYQTGAGSLQLFRRLDFGSTTNKPIRYKDDVYDRTWSPYNCYNCKSINNSLTVLYETDYNIPSIVMQTAAVPADDNNSLQFSFKPTDPSFQYYVGFYFAEVESLPSNQTREIDIYFNGRKWSGHESEFPIYLVGEGYHGILANGEDNIELSIKKIGNSTLPPILNAFEIYRVQEFQTLLTNQRDVEAIMNIKSKYGVKRNWQGDPCAPKLHLWQGLNCSYGDYDPPSIISLNLSSSGITGDISYYISSLTSIQILDLSNNSLTGRVPDFLSELQHLTVLNLTGNRLEGSIPVGLMEMKKNGLILSVDGNPKLCPEASCTEKNNFTVPVLAAALSFSLLLTAVAILWNLKTRHQVGKRNGSLELRNLSFSYSDLVRITNNFERVVGKGGFGTVYHGYLDDTQVAVKMLSPSSVQGYKQFQAEVKLLMRIHHKNLTTLVGYCDEGINMGLIYEFMANGNLETHLLAQDDTNIFSWEGRLRIAAEAAQGLEYLHSGCKPPIVHRDVKSTNILLNENFQAKLSDFGLSRIFPIEGGTHVSTTVAGTPGYLDPEYYISDRLTEKSDVYSFGVVLLELMTCKPVIEKSQERTHISQWVSFMLAKADIKNIVDPRLQGDFDINSVRKAVEIAMACISPTAIKRPTMTKVMIELNECLAMEIARKKVDNDIESKDSIELYNSDLHAEKYLTR